MARYILVVHSNASVGQDDEYNKWYEDIHLPEVLAIEGFVSAQRFRLNGNPPRGTATHQYLAIYEMDTNDPHGAMAALQKAVGNGDVRMSEAIDMASVSAAIFEPIGPVAKS